jgi:inorganic pyrophosphatase
MNLWHDVPLGDRAPDEFNVIVEIPRGSNNKYEIDKETGLIALDRANYNAAPYPFDYGFVPQTLWDDGDALDVAILTTWPLDVGIVVKVRPIAVIEMIDDGESDYKIVAVPANDKRWDDTKDLEDLNKHKIHEITHFFKTYKELKDPDNPPSVKIDGVGGRKEAIEAVEKSIKLYKDKFSK